MRKRPVLQMFVVGVIGVAILIPIALVIPWFPPRAQPRPAMSGRSTTSC